jgi:translocation and assembly module TamA
MRQILAIGIGRSWLIFAAGMLAAGGIRAETTIEGLTEESLANVTAFMSLDDLDCDVDEPLVRREYRVADNEIRQALSALGFYEPAIASELSFGDECWQATFEIMPGERTVVRVFVLEIDGAEDDVVFNRIATSPGIVTGDGLHHGRYETLKRRLLDAARDRGYPEAEFTASRLDVFPELAVADIELRFRTGPRYRFGEIRYDQEALAENFVSRYISIRPGEPFDNSALASTYVALTDSSYFESIDVRALEPDPATQTIPVRVALIAAPRLSINYGVGFSTDTGPRVRIGRGIHRFNDRGHQLSVQSQLSPVVSEVGANYRFPIGDPRREWASFDAGIKREETDSATSKSLEFGARRVLERDRGWSHTQFVDLLVEDFDVGDQQGRSRLLMPGINWTRLRADNTLRPTRGDKLNIELRGAGDAFGSDTSFVQTIISYKLIRSLPRGSRVLARATVGATAEDRFEDLPPSVRFFAGGDNSIRGYDFESIGPVDASGKVIGGSNLFVGSIEYEFQVRPKWSVAAFVDTGNAFAGSDLDAKTGVGVGARWLSPLGPIRIDIGVPVNDPDHSPRIHISLGPDL